MRQHDLRISRRVLCGSDDAKINADFNHASSSSCSPLPAKVSPVSRVNLYLTKLEVLNRSPSQNLHGLRTCSKPRAWYISTICHRIIGYPPFEMKNGRCWKSLLAAAGDIHNFNRQHVHIMSTKPNPNPNVTLTLCAIVDMAPAAGNTIWLLMLQMYVYSQTKGKQFAVH